MAPVSGACVMGILDRRTHMYRLGHRDQHYIKSGDRRKCKPSICQLKLGRVATHQSINQSINQFLGWPR